eukprot:6475542-Amphidinium_carterae.1
MMRIWQQGYWAVEAEPAGEPVVDLLDLGSAFGGVAVDQAWNSSIVSFRFRWPIVIQVIEMVMVFVGIVPSVQMSQMQKKRLHVGARATFLFLVLGAMPALCVFGGQCPATNRAGNRLCARTGSLRSKSGEPQQGLQQCVTC